MKRIILCLAVVMVAVLCMGSQPAFAATFIINSSGGDCTSIGNWDPDTYTCTLLEDVNDSIQIVSDSVTLDGNRHTVKGSGSGFGIEVMYLVSGVTIKNVTVNNFEVGISLKYPGFNTLEGNTTSGNIVRGISIDISEHNTLIGNTASNNIAGITLLYCDNNTLTGNTLSYNEIGIEFAGANWNTLTENTISNNTDGFHFASSPKSSDYNEIIHNNFIDNTTHVVINTPTSESNSNVFFNSPPTGGNFWSGHTTPDGDGDGFVDTPYTFTGGQDNYPWVVQDGWKTTTPIDMIEDLQIMVIDLNLQQGIANSLDAKLTDCGTSPG